MFAKYFHLLQEGGFFMYPILICSIFALTVMAERIYTLFFVYSLKSKAFIQKVVEALERGEVNRAIDYCHQHESQPLAKVLKSGLLKAHRGDKEIHRSMEATYLDVSQSVQERSGSLAVLANVATLLGLLGTVQGLITSFNGIVNVDAAQKQVILAAGISEALLATAFGLFVAIPCLIVYYLAVTKQNKILDSIQHGSTEVLNTISASNRDLRAGPAKVTDISKARG